MANTAATAAPALTPMMSGLASWLLARRWKIAPDSPKAAPTAQAGQAAGQAQRADDELVLAGPVAAQRRDDVGQGDREVADVSDQHEHADRGGASDGRDGNGAHVAQSRG